MGTIIKMGPLVYLAICLFEGPGYFADTNILQGMNFWREFVKFVKILYNTIKYEL